MLSGRRTGVGEAIAKVLAREGAKVAITGRRQDELEHVVEDIERTRNDSQGAETFASQLVLPLAVLRRPAPQQWSMSYKGIEGSTTDEQQGQALAEEPIPECREPAENYADPGVICLSGVCIHRWWWYRRW